MTRRRCFASISWLVLTLALCPGGCDRPSSPTAGGTDASSSDTILIGGFFSLTGSTATFGQTTTAGINLAIDEINAAGGVNGKKLVIKIYDNQGKTQETGTVVKRLITEDKVVAVVGEVASTQSLAAAPICQQSGVPMVSPSSTNPQVTQVGDMIFRVCFIDPDQGYAGAKFAYENLNARKVAVLYDQKQAYSVGLKNNFEQWFKKLGGVITSSQAYSGGDSDFSAQLTSIRDTQPDAVYVPGYYTDVGSLAIQARRLGIKVPLLGGDGWESPKLAEIGGEAIEGGYYTNHYAPEDDRPESVAFVEAYRKRYNEMPGALGALGYDAIKILADAMGRAKSLGGKDLAAALAATKQFQGVTGEITIDKDRNASKSMVIIEIKNGKPVYVTTITPPQP